MALQLRRRNQMEMTTTVAVLTLCAVGTVWIQEKSANQFVLIQILSSVVVICLSPKIHVEENPTTVVGTVPGRMMFVEPLPTMTAPDIAHVFGSHKEHVAANLTHVLEIVP
ncbi:MAG: hypothetical protein AAB853_04550 [Patescibacteria group bacterium]